MNNNLSINNKSLKLNNKLKLSNTLYNKLKETATEMGVDFSSDLATVLLMGGDPRELAVKFIFTASIILAKKAFFEKRENEEKSMNDKEISNIENENKLLEYKGPISFNSEEIEKEEKIIFSKAYTEKEVEELLALSDKKIAELNKMYNIDMISLLSILKKFDIKYFNENQIEQFRPYLEELKENGLSDIYYTEANPEVSKHKLYTLFKEYDSYKLDYAKKREVFDFLYKISEKNENLDIDKIYDEQFKID